jgi:hypothetical protein
MIVPYKDPEGTLGPLKEGGCPCDRCGVLNASDGAQGQAADGPGSRA